MTHNRYWLLILSAGVCINCSDSPVEGISPGSSHQALSNDSSADAGEPLAEDRPLPRFLERSALPDGKVPVLEIQTGPRGGQYGLYVSIQSLDGGPEITDHGVVEYETSTGEGREIAAPAHEEVPNVPPKVDPDIERGIANGAKEFLVQIWLKEAPSVPPYLELQKAVFRGAVSTERERRDLQRQLLTERQGRVAQLGESTIAAIALSGGKLRYRCINSACLVAQVSSDAIKVLADNDAIDMIELADGEGHDDSPTGGNIGSASQLFPYYDEDPATAKYTGEGVVQGGGVQDEVIVAQIEQGIANEEHPGFSDSPGGGPRIHSRHRCFTDGDGDLTCAEAVDIADGSESLHATGVLGVVLGDLMGGQDPGQTSFPARRTRSGYAVEAEAHVIASNNGGPTFLPAMDIAQSLSPAAHVANISYSIDTDDVNCTGTSALDRELNDLFEVGILPVKSAGNNTNSSTSNCNIGSPGAAIGSFTVGALGTSTDTGLSALRSAVVSPLSSRGGTSSEGNNRSIVDIAAPGCRGNAFDLLNGYGYETNPPGLPNCSTSFATPQVSALAIDLIDWEKKRPGATDLFAFNPLLVHAVLSLMGDRGTAGASNTLGVGRLRARLFTNKGMDAPWGMSFGMTCVPHGGDVIIPIGGTPIDSINVVKAAAYWYDQRHELGVAPDQITLQLRRASSSTVLSTDASTDESAFVIARQSSDSGSDVIQSVPLSLRLFGANVTADNSGCGTNQMLVGWAYFMEDSGRDDADGPSASDVLVE